MTEHDQNQFIFFFHIGFLNGPASQQTQVCLCYDGCLNCEKLKKKIVEEEDTSGRLVCVLFLGGGQM